MVGQLLDRRFKLLVLDMLTSSSVQCVELIL